MGLWLPATPPPQVEENRSEVVEVKWGLPNMDARASSTGPDALRGPQVSFEVGCC